LTPSDFISWRSFSIAKSGNRDEENEDAYIPISGITQVIDQKPSRFLIADGATQTSFSALWAKSLVEACSKTSLSEANFYQSVHSARETWLQSFEGKEIPWHATEKVRQGAFCTLIWLEIHHSPLLPGNTFTWKALAIGDSCLFIARNQNIYLSLPIQNPDEFALSPTLIPTNLDRLSSIKGKIRSARGTLKQGDQIFLASDAFSAWIMKKSPADDQQKNLVQLFNRISDLKSFSTWINSLRKTGEMKNDDTTLIIIEPGEKTDAAR
jgi:hypothetical protein